MIISAIAALAHDRVIGVKNGLPWHLPLEFKYFKDTTMGHTLITGRKNFESIGKPLPGRPTIIVTRNKEYKRSDCDVVYDFESALKLAYSKGEKEVFVTGGAEIYELSLPYLHRFYCTYIDLKIEGDTRFPEFEHLNWKKKQLVTEMNIHEKNSHSWKAYLLEKDPSIKISL